MHLRKPLLVAAAGASLAAGALAVTPLSGDAASPGLQFVVAEGRSVKVPPDSVTDADSYVVTCPSGYVGTGHGLNTGGATLVFADPQPHVNGFAFAFLNDDDSNTATVSATVVCAKGKNLRVRAASLSAAERERAVARARARVHRP